MYSPKNKMRKRYKSLGLTALLLTILVIIFFRTSHHSIEPKKIPSQSITTSSNVKNDDIVSMKYISGGEGDSFILTDSPQLNHNCCAWLSSGLASVISQQSSIPFSPGEPMGRMA
jgi:hypothetical protein